MCRNIRTLFNFEPPATEAEIGDAARQYVRKVSGTTRPSKANLAAFERAVDEALADDDLNTVRAITASRRLGPAGRRLAGHVRAAN